MKFVQIGRKEKKGWMKAAKVLDDGSKRLDEILISQFLYAFVSQMQMLMNIEI
jgi:hypothetical protein